MNVFLAFQNSFFVRLFIIKDLKMILSRIIKRVEKLIDFLGKIWKSEILKVINNKT
jgi:hypothetical protein